MPSFLEKRHNFSGTRVSFEAGFLEDHSSVACHLEPPPARRNELHVGVGILRPDFGRQTDGPRFVVSKGAVLD